MGPHSASGLVPTSVPPMDQPSACQKVRALVQRLALWTERLSALMKVLLLAWQSAWTLELKELAMLSAPRSVRRWQQSRKQFRQLELCRSLSN